MSFNVWIFGVYSGGWQILRESQLDLHRIFLVLSHHFMRIYDQIPRVQVGPDDPHHGRLRSEPRDAAGQDHRRLLRAVRSLHPHAAHPHRGQQLRHLLQKQVKHAQTCKRCSAIFGTEIGREKAPILL